MTNSHADCLHPATSTARARCRKERAQYLADHKFEIELDRLTNLAAERHAGRNGLMTTAQHALAAGVENADDSLEDLNIEQYSEAWYSLAISGFWSIMDSTPGNDLRWQINIEDATREEIDNAPDTYPDFY